MRRLIAALFFAAFLLPSFAFAAWGSGMTATEQAITCVAPSCTLSCTNTSGDLFLAQVNQNATATDRVTAVTYNGSSMTKAAWVSESGVSHGGWWMVAPSTGANNVVITTSSNFNGTLICASFTGAAQSGQPDAVAVTSSGSGTSRTVNITTATDNALVIGFFGDNNGTLTTAGSGTQIVKKTADSEWSLDGSNPFAVTPAGATSVIHNNSAGGAFTGGIAISFKMASAVTPSYLADNWWWYYIGEI